MTEVFIRHLHNRYVIQIFVAFGCYAILSVLSFMPYPTAGWVYFWSGAALLSMLQCLIMFNAKWFEAIHYAQSIGRIAQESTLELWIRKQLHRGVQQGCVYILQDMDVTNWYKIGKSTKPSTRIGHFDIELPFEVRVVHIIESKNCSALETILHTNFSEQRKRGEWFDLSYADIEWIKEMESV